MSSAEWVTWTIVLGIVVLTYVVVPAWAEHSRRRSEEAARAYYARAAKEQEQRMRQAGASHFFDGGES